MICQKLKTIVNHWRKNILLKTKQEVSNENPYFKYGLIVAGGVVVLGMLKVAISIFRKKG